MNSGIQCPTLYMGMKDEIPLFKITSHKNIFIINTKALTNTRTPDRLEYDYFREARYCWVLDHCVLHYLWPNQAR